MRRLFAAPFFVALLLLASTGAGVVAQRKGARAPRNTTTQKPSPQATTSNTNAAASSESRGGRLGSLRSSETGTGSRVTVTSDSALNDYSAYRSGDRYYVKLPKANAKDVKGGLRGKGFEDAQVQQQGDDVVLSIRLQPGASARVNQKFNRLNVEVVAPGGQDATDASDAKPTTTTASTQRPTTDPRNQNRTTANTTTTANTNSAQSRLANSNNRATTPTNDAVLDPNDASNNVANQDFNPSLMPTTTETPVATPVATPATVETEVAQVQQPAPPAPVTTTQTAPAASSGTSIAGVVLQNWPLALIAMLLLVGLGLFFAARRTSAKRDQADDAPAAIKETPVSTAALSSNTAATAATTTATTKTTTTAETSAKTTAKTTTADASSDASSSVKGVAGGLAAAALVADSQAAQSGVSGESAKTDAAVARGRAGVSAPTSVEFDSERVQAETKKLLDGESYDAAVISVSDTGMRELVAAELLAALASRNEERRARARRAFIQHGYFDDAQENLRSADAPAERASSARSLGLVGDRAATAALVAALEDSATEVRRASVEALAEVRDPAAVKPLEQLRKREKDQKRKVARTLIQRAIEACASAPAKLPVEVAPTPVETATAPVTEAATSVVGVAETTVQEQTQTREEIPSVAATTSPISAETPVLTSVETPVETTIETAVATEAEAAILPSEETPAASTEETLAASPAIVEFASPVVFEEEAAVSDATVEQSRVEAEEATAEFEPVALVQPDADATETEPTLFEPLPEATAPDRLQAIAGELFTSEEENLGLSDDETGEVEASDESGIFVPTAETTTPTTTQAESDSATTPELVFETHRAVDVTETTSVKAIEPVEASHGEAAADWIELDMEEEELAYAEAPAESSTPATPRPAGFETTAIELATEQTAAEPSRGASASYPVEPPIEAESPLKSLREAVNERRIDVFVPTPAAKPAPPTRKRAAETSQKTAEAEQSVEGGSWAGEDEKSVEVYSTVPKAIQQRLASDEPSDRATALADLARLDADESFRQICAAFDDESPEVRDEAARSLYTLTDDHADAFTRALREASNERRRNIGASLASSGLADDAISQLTGESRDKTYDAFSLLFLMAKAGEVQPLIRAVESHSDNEVRLAVVKLLALSGQQEILPHFRRLAVRGSLPTEVRSAVMEAIYQISSSSGQPASDTSRVG
jgi:HEAT repeat protein